MTTRSSNLKLVATNDTFDHTATSAARIVTLQEEIDQRQKEIDAIKADLADTLPEGTTTAGPYKVVVTVAKRLDSKAIEEDYPVATNPLFYTRAIDTKFARVHLDKTGVLDRYLIAGKPSVKVL